MIIVDAGVVAIATRGLLFAVSPARGLWIGANRKFCFYARKGAKVCYLRVRSFSGPIFQCMKGSVSITPLMRELSLRLAEQGSKKNPKGLYPQLLARVTVNELRKLEPCFGSIRRHVKLNAPLSKSEKEWLERERAIN
ncbi:MAG: hypothetical protein KIT13_00710 [Burkholderiales bacterium]|nr:hypothetical protein [Burkholderiales bacterium]